MRDLECNRREIVVDSRLLCRFRPNLLSAFLGSSCQFLLSPCNPFSARSSEKNLPFASGKISNVCSAMITNIHDDSAPVIVASCNALGNFFRAENLSVWSSSRRVTFMAIFMG